MFELVGRVALITGAGQGVGAAIARTLASQGAAVAVNDLAPDRAGAVVESLDRAGLTAVAAVADIVDGDPVGQMVAGVEEVLGPIDILVNNAGIPASGITLRPFVDTGPPDWEPFVNLNLYGVLHCTRAVLPGMIARRWGRVVTIVSDAGRVGEPNQAVYAASKAAAMGFTRSIAKEVGRDEVTCNCIALATIVRPDVELDPDLLAKQLKRYSVKRLGQPSDVAAAVAWLVSEEAAWVTGQTIPVNGGYSTS